MWYGSSFGQFSGIYKRYNSGRSVSEEQQVKSSKVGGAKKEEGMRKVIEYIAVLSFLLLLILLFAGLFLYMFRSFFYSS